jgi:hypothetical protein
LDLHGYCPDNPFGLFVFAESLKEQLQIEQKDKIRNKDLKEKPGIFCFTCQNILFNWNWSRSSVFLKSSLTPVSKNLQRISASLINKLLPIHFFHKPSISAQLYEKKIHTNCYFYLIWPKNFKPQLHEMAR